MPCMLLLCHPFTAVDVVLENGMWRGNFFDITQSLHVFYHCLNIIFFVWGCRTRTRCDLPPGLLGFDSGWKLRPRHRFSFLPRLTKKKLDGHMWRGTEIFTQSTVSWHHFSFVPTLRSNIALPTYYNSRFRALCQHYNTGQKQQKNTRTLSVNSIVRFWNSSVK